MTDGWLIVLGLAVATYAIRLGGVLLGQQLPQSGAWARALDALPGSLIFALLSVLLLTGGPTEWLAGSIAATVAVVTRNLPLTMICGIGVVWLLRQFFS